MKYKIEFEIEIDDSLGTQAEVEEWVKFEVGATSSMSYDKHLSLDHNLRASNFMMTLIG